MRPDVASEAMAIRRADGGDAHRRRLAGDPERPVRQALGLPEDRVGLRRLDRHHQRARRPRRARPASRAHTSCARRPQRAARDGSGRCSIDESRFKTRPGRKARTTSRAQRRRERPGAISEQVVGFRAGVEEIDGAAPADAGGACSTAQKVTLRATQKVVALIEQLYLIDGGAFVALVQQLGWHLRPGRSAHGARDRVGARQRAHATTARIEDSTIRAARAGATS